MIYCAVLFLCNIFLCSKFILVFIFWFEISLISEFVIHRKMAETGCSQISKHSKNIKICTEIITDIYLMTEVIASRNFRGKKIFMTLFFYKNDFDAKILLKLRWTTFHSLSFHSEGFHAHISSSQQKNPKIPKKSKNPPKKIPKRFS